MPCSTDRSNRFGAIDQTDGGDAQRYSLSARWSRADEKSASKVEGYFIYQTLNLYNNFTYFLDNPTDGDQFHQTDKRKILGLNASHTQNHSFLGFEAATTLGTQFRYDDIAVGLFNTVQRMPTGTVRNDHVSETSIGLYAESKVKWTDWLRSTIGVRGDMYWASVDSDTAANSGQVNAFLASPKAGLVFGPFAKTELYLNAGLGFHSNDVRGATITVDPTDRVTPQQRVPLLVRSRGAEVGARTQFVKGLDSTLALFLLEFELRAPVRGRRRHDGGEPAEPPHRRRMDQPLPAGILGLARFRPRLHPGALHRLRSRGQLHPGISGHGRRRRHRPGRADGLVRRACAGATSAPARWSRTAA